MAPSGGSDRGAPRLCPVELAKWLEEQYPTTDGQRAALLKRVGISSEAFRNWRAGKSLPRRRTLEDIAGALGWTMDSAGVDKVVQEVGRCRPWRMCCKHDPSMPCCAEHTDPPPDPFDRVDREIIERGERIDNRKGDRSYLSPTAPLIEKQSAGVVGSEEAGPAGSVSGRPPADSVTDRRSSEPLSGKKKAKTYETAIRIYTRVKQLGQGGNGVVELVRDEAGREYAVKLVRTGRLSTEQRQRLTNEIGTGWRLRHANIVTVLDQGFFDDEGGRVIFYVMPFYPQVLRSRIGSLRPDEAFSIARGLASALAHAHREGVWHRDLKPENVALDGHGAPVLLDFGIAHVSEDLQMTAVETRENTRFGNFQYAAPEQRAKGKPSDHRADIYVFGMMLNELFTGVVPEGKNHRLIADVSRGHAELDTLVDRMMSQDPSRRPSAAEVLAALDGRADTGGPPPPDTVNPIRPTSRTSGMDSWIPLSIWQKAASLTVPPWSSEQVAFREAGRTIHRHIAMAYTEAVDMGAPREFVYQLSLHVPPSETSRHERSIHLALVCHVAQFVQSFAEIHELFLGGPETDSAYTDRTHSTSDRIEALKLRTSYAFEAMLPYRICMIDSKAISMKCVQAPYVLQCPTSSSDLLVALSAFARGKDVQYERQDEANLSDRALFDYPLVAKRRKNHMELVAKDFEVSVHEPEAWRPSESAAELWR